MMRSFFFPAVVSLLFMVQIGLGQTTGTISGFVQDDTKGVLPGVEIQAVQDGTGLNRSVISTETGTYTIPSLPPGTYTLTFSLPGFQTVNSRNIIVNATERVTVSVTLPVARSGTTVEVSTAAQLIQAETTS